MSDQSTFSTLIARKVGTDRRGLDPLNFVQEAVRIYERYRPRVVTVSVTGDGTEQYALATVATAWLAGYSVVKRVEYPAGEDPPVFLDENEYFIRDRADSGSARVQDLQFHSASPGASETFLLQHTARHTVSASASTIPAEDEEAIGDIGAQVFLEAIAVRYGGLSSQEGISADLVFSYDEKARAARDGARDAKRRWRTMLGLPAKDEDSGPGAAIAFLDHDARPARGRSFLTHRELDR